MTIPSHPSVFVAVQNMGLGHATRTLPIIKYFWENKWKVFVGSSGRSLTFLTREFPALTFVDLPDYNLGYSDKGVRISGLIRQVPAVLRKISEENIITGDLVSSQQIRMIISDHRYGCYRENIPSFFITHQVRFIAPHLLRPFEFAGALFNRHYHRKFSEILIPDFSGNGEGLLSGRLSRTPSDLNYRYIGILSSICRKPVQEDIDYFFSVSGPEPQRTIFEKILRQQVDSLVGQKVMALGKPESLEIEKPSSDLTIYHHLGRAKMKEMLNRSKFIISRPGYSTLMELAELGKKSLLVPTPGQTEQLYLSRRFQQAGWYYSVPQDKIDLSRDVTIALNFTGFPFTMKTLDSLKLIDELAKKVLSKKIC
jgi:uncharacterized protein (TIGR00661 family)